MPTLGADGERAHLHTVGNVKHNRPVGAAERVVRIAHKRHILGHIRDRQRPARRRVLGAHRRRIDGDRALPNPIDRRLRAAGRIAEDEQRRARQQIDLRRALATLAA